jgi:hypothetical protein
MVSGLEKQLFFQNWCVEAAPVLEEKLFFQT